MTIPDRSGAGSTASPASDTLGHVEAPRTPYGSLWRAVPRELAFLILTFPLALTGFVVTVTLFATGFGTLVTFFLGVVLIIVALYVSRGFGTLELVRLELAGRPVIDRPEWQDARAREGFGGWLRSTLGNGHYWLYLLHTMVINFFVSVLTWTITIAWVATAFGGLTYWFWRMFLPAGQDWYLVQVLANLLRWDVPRAAVGLLEALVLLAVGTVVTLTLPFVTRGLVLVHDAIARPVLGAFKSDALEREVIALNASRGAAMSAEGQSLRRLERDIHDGPQQRLVRLQMDLAAAERQLDTDPERARATIAEAMQQSRDALEELRSLSRGFAPPILLDRGLVAALESAATRSPVPARVISFLPADPVLPQEIERNAYFVASEALANAAKHSQATDVEVRVQLSGTADAAQPWLEVVVTDNGAGGAVPVAGHGLAGLEERMRGLGGQLTVYSPPGGPTVVRAVLPVRS